VYLVLDREIYYKEKCNNVLLEVNKFVKNPFIGIIDRADLLGINKNLVVEW